VVILGLWTTRTQNRALRSTRHHAEASKNESTNADNLGEEKTSGIGVTDGGRKGRGESPRFDSSKGSSDQKTGKRRTHRITSPRTPGRKTATRAAYSRFTRRAKQHDQERLAPYKSYQKERGGSTTEKNTTFRVHLKKKTLGDRYQASTSSISLDGFLKGVAT